MASAYRSLGLILATMLLSSLWLSSLPATHRQGFATAQLPITLDELLDPRSEFDGWKPDLSPAYKNESIDLETRDVNLEHGLYLAKPWRWPRPWSSMRFQPYSPPRLRRQ